MSHPRASAFFVLVLAAALFLPAAGRSQISGIPDPCLTTADPVNFPVNLGCCPAGDGETLSNKGARIEITVRDYNGIPIPSIPPTDIWLIGWNSQLVLCGGSASSNADGPTDVNGMTSITGTLAVGGMDNGVAIVIQGIVLLFPLNCSDIRCLALNVRSVDVNGDLAVNLVDLAVFAAAFPPNAYNMAVDFNFDHAVGLVDLALFAQHFLHTC